MKFTVQQGLAPDHIPQAAAFFWDAFKDKLSMSLGPEPKAHKFLTKVINPDHAICATGADGQLLGVAGFKTAKGSFAGGEMRDLQQVYGLFGGLWRGLMLSALERDLDKNTLLMDGIFVASEARGHGVGSALLNGIVTQANSLGLEKVRLDVIDTNPRARQLYERFGFKATGTQNLGPLRYVFGFNAATHMLFTLPTTQD